MFRIGIIGAENTHSLAIAKLLNMDKKIPGARVVAIWGETLKLARQRSEEARIPRIVRDPKEMIGSVDGVMVDHRHGKFHLPAAWPFLKAGIPIFVDKPFCTRLAEGKRFLGEAKERKVTVTSFSTLKLIQDFSNLKKDVKKLGKPLAVASWGPANIKGQKKYGGIFFYGCHQIEMLLNAFGNDVLDVQASLSGPNAAATMRFMSGLVATAFFLAEGIHRFEIAVRGEKDSIHRKIDSDENDEDPELTGTRLWIKALRTGKAPFTAEDLLAPIAVLEAIEKSLANRGARVRVASVRL